MIGPGPERQPVPQAPREVVTRMSIDGLEKSEDDPDVDRDDVKVRSDEAVEEGTADGAHTEDEDFEGVSVFGGESEGCRVLVVHLVDVLVERTVVECSVSEVMPGVFEDEEEGDLGDDDGPGWEGDGMRSQAKVFSHRMESPDLNEQYDQQYGQYQHHAVTHVCRSFHRDRTSATRTHLGQLDGEMTQEHGLGALPHLGVRRHLGRLKLVLPEHGHLVDDDPGNASSKVDDLVKEA